MQVHNKQYKNAKFELSDGATSPKHANSVNEEMLHIIVR